MSAVIDVELAEPSRVLLDLGHLHEAGLASGVLVR
jgi:hypothetical protein